MRAAAVLFAAGWLCAPAMAQAPRYGEPLPAGAGWALSLGFGASWHSNPLELTRRAKGDGFIAPEIGLSYRLPLWSGAALVASATTNPELYAREESVGVQRGFTSLALSQNWAGTIFNLSVSARKSLSHDFGKHESASQEIGLGVSRTFVPIENWSLTLSGRVARRAVDDGTKDQFRGGFNALLAYRSGAWIWRAGAGFGYVLEDKTPILPRINDRSVSVRAGLGYEWARDREVTLGASYTRTFSSYQPNRTKVITIQPRVAATIRF
ncbi:MAG: hypothetical protein ACRDBL_03195 [Rhabdaerophilum sp.]